ncbi:MAG: thiol:disulfide interchange protein [Myxococcales bacterium]|nr:thiol:disulfide interchange protein [Myxococcales bacterium]
MLRKISWLISLAMLLTAVAPALLAAQEPATAPSPKVRAEMLADVDALAPGAPFRLGVRFHVEKEWHIYWVNPGEAGIPTQVKWNETSGITPGELQYPAPILFGASSPISGYGYEDEVLLFVEATAPKIFPSQPHKFSAKASWLVCRNTCVPGSQEVSLTLPPATAVEPGKNRALFDQAQAAVPPPAERIAGLTVRHTPSVSAVQPDKDFQILFVLKGPAGVRLAPRADSRTPVFAPFKSEMVEAGKIEVDDPRPEPREELAVKFSGHALPEMEKAEKIGGVFQLDWIENGRKTPVVFSFTVELPFAATGATVEHNPLPDFAAPVATVGGAMAAAGQSVWLMLLFAFVGGIILNVMPCVLPVVSIKILSLVNQSQMSRKDIRRHGQAYAAGIIVTFLILAIAVAILKSGGEAIGWGFQFQSPLFVALLAALVFVFGLSLLDVFVLTAPTGAALQEAVAKEGLRGSFFNGIFAVILATPCTAPFLGTAIGFAFTQPTVVTFLIFLAVAGGLAFPFLLLAYVPAWKKFLPKPGDWMDTFKSVMGFLLLGTVIWLLDVLGKQTGGAGLIRMLCYLGLLGFGAWLYGRFGNITRTAPVRVAATIFALALAAGAGFYLLRFTPPAPVATASEAFEAGGIAWQPFSEKKLQELLAADQTVFMDFTAAWCWTCKVNEKAVIETDPVRQALHELKIVPVRGDWTNRNPEISAFLKAHGKAGVPVYAVAGPGTGKEIVLLPEVITKEMVIAALEKAVKGS